MDHFEHALRQLGEAFAKGVMEAVDSERDPRNIVLV
tara:strand:+ start:550 stop:657 length:108 start_codon:yes stop_codon:yes gene_type:complete